MDKNWRNWGAGAWLAFFMKGVVALVVIAFIGLLSLEFFQFVFPPEKSYFGYLGFGLTGGGVIAYLLILKYGSPEPLQKTIAMIMLVVSVIGELVVAGFGMQVEGWKSAGMIMLPEDIKSMILFIQLLGFAHAGALIAQVAGTDIMKAFEKPVVSTENSSSTAISLPVPSSSSVPFPIPTNQKDFTDKQ